MQRILFAKLNSGEEVSVYDVSSGLSCNCVCLHCGKPLIANRYKYGWYFSHQVRNTKCTINDNISITKLLEQAFRGISEITLPDVGYTIDDDFVKVSDKEKFKISKVVSDNNASITLYGVSNDKVILTLTNSFEGKTDDKVIKISFDNYIFKDCTDLKTLINRIKDKVLSFENNYVWLSHPELNYKLDLLKRSEYICSSSLGLSKLYCPQKDALVNVNDCKKCNFKLHLSKNRLTCRGNLTKEQLIELSPNIVFPPEEVNYIGKCSICGSNATAYKELSDEYRLYRMCCNCNKAVEVTCPICEGVLHIKTNKDARFESYNSKFIGCDNCSFTLTYKKPNGEYADEIMYTGGIDKIREDKNRYLVDLIKYRNARKHQRSGV